MKKIFIIVCSLVVILSGCSSSTVDTIDLKFSQKGDDYSLEATEDMASYNQLIDDLNALNIELTEDTPVAVIATSTANILTKLDMNIVASTESKDLNEQLSTQIENGEVINLGSALDPNLELLYQSEAEVVFVGSNMPHIEQYEFLDNLVVLPQQTYPEIFYTTYGLISTFGLGEQAQSVFNNLVTVDQQAKQNVTDKELGQVAILKYAYGNVTIAPDNTYAGSLLTELDIENMYGELKDVDLPMDREKLLADNPDIIIIYGKGDDVEGEISSLIASEKLDNLNAVVNDNVYVLQSQSLNVDIDSPNTLLELSEDIYGE